MFRRGVLLILAVLEVRCDGTDPKKSIFDNATSPSARQLLEFKIDHPRPIGLLTLDSGAPVDVRNTINVNNDFFGHDFFFQVQSNIDAIKVQERTVAPKGIAGWGYFEVTNDITKYTKADVFSEVGKTTPLLARFGIGTTDKGASDLGRRLRTMSFKLYTKEGNLDFMCLHSPVFAFTDPLEFSQFVHALLRNPATGLFDLTQLADVASLKPTAFHILLFLFSDYGIPDGFRYMNGFPIHTYQLVNKKGVRSFVRFNFRSEQGLRNLTSQQAAAIQAVDEDYFLRDMYNALENKQYPSWKLEMDVLTIQDIQKVDYNPFDVTKLWKNGTYKTVPVGRVVIDRNSDNQFRDNEQAAFSPSNLVPGIPGPVDPIFRARRYAYRDTQNYRIGRNHNKVGVNAPLYPAYTYSRDGRPPVLSNMKDVPTYYPNSFNGPIPFVDEDDLKERLDVLFNNAVDLQDAADFYNFYLKDDGARQRLSENIAFVLYNSITEPTKSRYLRYIRLIDQDFYRRVVTILQQFVLLDSARNANTTTTAKPKVKLPKNAKV